MTIRTVDDLLSGYGVTYSKHVGNNFWSLTTWPTAAAKADLAPYGYVTAASSDCRSKAEYPCYFIGRHDLKD